MRYACHTVGALEVPGEISLIYTITGCPLRCRGCHSADLRSPEAGRLLEKEDFAAELKLYDGLASCVCFLGGEWEPDELIEWLRDARAHGYKTCLYTGRSTVDDRIAVELDYVKLGPFVPELGGLDAPGTNQRFLNLRTGRDMTAEFQRHSTPALEPGQLAEAA
jgi:anaerobic ribonucleoside-triphosphate reductase activating protein